MVCVWGVVAVVVGVASPRGLPLSCWWQEQEQEQEQEQAQVGGGRRVVVVVVMMQQQPPHDARATAASPAG